MHTAPLTIVQAPTQTLRNMIEGNACGLVLADELHNELMNLETRMGWTLTHPTEQDES